MPRSLHVLLIEDSPADAELVLRELQRAGIDPVWQRVDTEQAFLAQLHGGLDLILSDYAMPTFNGLRALELLKQSGLDVPFILVSATIGEDMAVAAIRQGAADYLMKDRLARLGPAIDHALEQTRLRREKAEADKALQRQAAFAYHNPNPVLELSAVGELNYCNTATDGMARLLGEKHAAHILPSGTKAIVRECLATGRPLRHLETQVNGRTIAWSLFPVPDNNTVHCYATDITERKLLEEQLRQSQKMEAIGQLSGGIAHDFNNLLTAIIGHLGLLRGNPQVTPEIDESLSEISAAANRAAKLTSQLLAFSRRQVISARALDLNEVVTNLTKMLSRILGEDVVMQLDYAPEQLTFRGDAGMLEQVLVNLVVNARDAMGVGGAVRITTRGETCIPPLTSWQTEPGKPAAFVRLSVGDTGTGISPEIRSKIFEPFFTTKDVGKGTGLGLATVFGIVQQHHGWIEVESEIGRGTTFHVFLPRLATGPVAAATERLDPPARGTGQLVLLVEDEPSVQEVGRLALSQHGYQVVVAANGREALEVWAKRKAEIVLLLTDIIMPEGVSGLQLAQRLQQENPALKVVYTSGYNPEIAGKELTLTEGINYLAKPYELDQLFRTVRTALDGE